MKSRRNSILLSLIALALAIVFDVLVGNYVNSLSYGPPLGDLLLNNLPVIDVRLIEVFGFQLIMIAYFLYPIFFSKSHLSYVFFQTTLLIIIRNITIILTHLPSPAGTLDHNIVPLFKYFTFEHDLLFSGHVAFPFLAFLMYTTKRVRLSFLVASLVMAVAVLLTHSHYSIDVWAAFFFTYTSYKLGEHFFKPKQLEI